MIVVKDLVKRYGDRCAVDHLSFTIEEGKIYGFLGPNGAGKSTTLNIVTGYLSATEGSVTVDGHDVAAEPEKAKAAIGYLPEIPPLYDEMTVEEYLTFAAELKGVKKAEMAAQVQKVVSLAHLEDVFPRLIRNLSKGYRQRVGLAQAMLGQPKVLIFDEPTVGLDPKQITEIRSLIRTLAKDHTVILSSHILSEIQAVCDEVLILHHGKLVASDTVENLETRLSGAAVLSAEIRGSQSAVEKLLSSLKGAASFRVTEAEGVCSAEITCQKGCDIREALFFALAEARLPLLMLRFEEASLEKVFLELTREEEVEE
ncbi:MAG: ATP-binding cassette domain-containing protein [Oscillospiraceae bacterium]|nr:ATP-binding cassette domain-containing protein [Oscillospiraceae bacterium]